MKATLRGFICFLANGIFGVKVTTFTKKIQFVK